MADSIYHPPILENSEVAILCPTEEEALKCFELEQAMQSYSGEGLKNGFFIPGATKDEYLSFRESAFFRIFKLRGELAGFLIALPPGHARLQKLLSLRDKFELTDLALLGTPDLVWIAKVAASLTHRRQGVASKLYEHLFREFSASAFMTATLLTPFHNIPSQALQEAHGFANVGHLLMGSMSDRPLEFRTEW